MISRKGLAIASVVINVLDLGILVVLTAARGWPVIAFAVSGFLLSAAYTAPPLRLKKRGLGEPDVLVVWGPLMVGGTYYSAVGHLPWQVIAASLPYGLLCTAVLMGKHVDKIPWDEAEGIRTLPVILGDVRARRATQLLMAAFYVAVVINVAASALPWPSLLAIAALPAAVQAWRALGQPKPERPPADFPIWPLWFAAFAFLHTRRAGALLVLGLVVAAIADITPF
jgi:1,4-dihydroxy-2-naphthoate octaprenyltransferase